MTIKEVLTLPIEPWMHRETKKLRQNTPKFLKTIIEQTFEHSGISSLAELTRQSLISLEGGVSSAVYLIKKTENSIVIKLRHEGISAEAESMNAWKKKGANVIAIKTTGLLKSSDMTVKYLIQEGIMRQNGTPAESVDQFVLKNPKKALELGSLRGIELAKMHRAKSNRTFGHFSDMSAKRSPFKSWNSYLNSYIDSQGALLNKIGLTEAEIKKIKLFIKSLSFPKSGVYLHGDFKTSNNLIEKTNPLKIRIFDPNPLIGHPSWDIAFVFNQYELSKKRLHFNPADKNLIQTYKIEHDLLIGFIQGYEETVKQKIDRRKLYPSQFIHSVMHLSAVLNKARKKDSKSYWQDREVIDSKNTVLDMASMILLYS